MDAELTDVHRTLSYSSRKLYRQWLIWLALPALASGIALVVIRPATLDASNAFDWIMTAAALTLGLFLTVFCVYRLLVPGKPKLMLSPEGLRLHIEWVKDILIPWRAVEGVDTVDVTGEVRGIPVRFSGVTVVLVSRRFYDRYIHVNSWILRGPGWDTNFIPKGDMMQVALHHEALPATAQELRMAVEARWRAFRDADHTAAR